MSTPLARILVVDDNEMNRDMLSRRLRKQGYELDTAPGGREALEAIEKNEPDVVLLDIMMPGMDGFEVLQKIRETRSPSELPVIMATAKDEGTDIVKALELGANDYVTKPFDYPVVRARVATQVQLKQSGEELRASHDRMARDLAAAARIQRSLLPQAAPASEGFGFCWHYRPCDELAGDALNVVKLENGQIIFYLIDVSGHGVPSALLSVSVVHSLHPAPGPASVIWKRKTDDSGFEPRSPAEVVQRLNALYPIMDNGGLYFTMVYGLLDPENGTVHWVSAGHPLPILVRADGSAEEIGKPNTPVGMMPDLEYSTSECTLSGGDRIYLYSDGLTEVFDDEEEMFGEERLMDFLATAGTKPAEDVPVAVADYVLGWSGCDKFDDDLSFLVVEAN